jgi:hypothetical protein
LYTLGYGAGILLFYRWLVDTFAVPGRADLLVFVF